MTDLRDHRVDGILRQTYDRLDCRAAFSPYDVCVRVCAGLWGFIHAIS